MSVGCLVWPVTCPCHLVSYFIVCDTYQRVSIGICTHCISCLWAAHDQDPTLFDPTVCASSALESMFVVYTSDDVAVCPCFLSWVSWVSCMLLSMSVAALLLCHGVSLLGVFVILRYGYVCVCHARCGFKCVCHML